MKLTDHERRQMESATFDQVALAIAYSENKNHWEEFIDPDNTTDFDSTDPLTRYNLALLVITSNK